MAPLWKSMLSKSNPLYRDSLYSFSLWECRVQERELALLKKHTDRERRALLRQVDKLSKELQQKDKVIESLRAKLNQHQPRSDTPGSSHAPSETSDQSDRISFVSDEQGSTNGDLELCSDMDAASEYGQEERRASTRASADSHSHGGSMSRHPSIPPSTVSSHGHHSSVSCPGIQCSSHKAADIQSQTGYSLPPTKAFQGFPMPPHGHADPAGFLPSPYHTYQPSPIGGATCGLNASLNAMKPPGASLLESSALWDMSYGSRPMRVGADLSSGSSGYQSGASHTGAELMREHLREIRTLRQRLEDSIQTNDRLRQQLEERLANAAREKGAPTNIYIQGLDSVSQLSSDIRALKEENASLQGQLKQSSRECGEEVEQLREVVLLGRARLKEAELETERWAEQGKRLQTHTEAQQQEITQLKQERQHNQETINRLQHETTVLQQQLTESSGLVHSLQQQLLTYRKCGVSKNTQAGLPGSGSHSGDPGTFDPRDLHVQLEQRLTGGLCKGDASPHAKRQLFNDNVQSPPVRDMGLFSPLLPVSPTLKTNETSHHGMEGQAPDGSFGSRSGRHVVGHVDDFNALRQQLLEGNLLVRKMQSALQASSTSHTLLELSLDKPLDSGTLRNVMEGTKTLKQILEESGSLLKMFWRAALPSADGAQHNTKKEQSQKEEIGALRLRLSEQEEALRDAMESLKSSNRAKDSMEHFIVSQLSRTKDVLKKAKTNLQQEKRPGRDATVSLPALLVGVS